MLFSSNSILPADELSLDVELIQNRLSESSELVIFENNQPQFVIMTMEQYEAYIVRTVPISSDVRTSAAQSKLKIGRLVQESLRRLFYKDMLPESEILNLTSPEYSNSVFGLNFPVLKKYEPTLAFEDQKRDVNGYNRYYNFTLSHKSTQYLRCSQWIERLHRERFEIWLQQWDD